MARFIVIHQAIENTNQEDVLAAGKALYAVTPKASEWRNSWYAPETNELFCEWEAPDWETIRQALIQSGATRFFPVKTIHEVVPIDPKDYSSKSVA